MYMAKKQKQLKAAVVDIKTLMDQEWSKGFEEGRKYERKVVIRMIDEEQARCLSTNNTVNKTTATTNWFIEDVRRQRKMLRKGRWERRAKRTVRVIVGILILLALYVFADAAYRAFTDPSFVYVAEVRAAEVERVFIVAEVSAYTSSVEETDANPFENASGGMPGEGSVACPVRFAFGTRIAIEGVEYVCDDRMAKRYRDGNYFDVWKPSKAEAFEFGRQIIVVEIL